MKGKADIKRILLFGIPLLIIAIGAKMLDDEARIFWVETNKTESTSASFFLFSGEKERMLKATEDQTVQIEWKPNIDRGELFLEIVPPGDAEPYRLDAEPRSLDMELEEGDKLRLTVHGKNAKGSFLIAWEQKKEGG